jgi:anti-sigma factor RsiW
VTDRSHHAGAGAGIGRTGPPGYPPGYPPPADSCSPDQRIALGSYALGALDPLEADQVRRHLVECAACRTEYRELAAVPSVLARITETEMAAGPMPPDSELFTRLLARAAAREATGHGVAAPGAHAAPMAPEEPALPAAHAAAAAATAGPGHSRARRRRGAVGQKSSKSSMITSLWSGSLLRRASIAAAGGVLTAAAVIGVYGATSGSNSPAVFSKTVQAANSKMGISGTIQYHAAEWGSWVQVTMHNVPPGDDCTLLAVDAKGNRVVASTWWAPSSGTATIPGGVAMEADSIAKFEVVTADGTTLLDAPVS